MNRFLRAGVTSIAVGLILGAFAANEARAQGILHSILARMDAHSKSLLSLKADLKLVKDDAIIDETDTFEGVVTFLPKTGNRGRYMRIDWTKPRAQSISLRDDVFESYVPALRTMTVGTATQISVGSSGVFSLLAMSKRQITENYVVVYFGQEQIIGGVQTWHLRITPKKSGYYKFTDVWVDGDGMPLQVTESVGSYSTRAVNMERFGWTRAIMAMTKRTEEETGVKISCEIEPAFEFVTDTTTLRLSRLKKNEPVEGSIFKINVPPGTRIIKG